MVLASLRRMLAADAVAMIRERFMQQPTVTQATVGGLALDLDRARSVAAGVKRQA